MKAVSDFNRELASGIAALQAHRTQPVESAVNVLAAVLGMAAGVGFGLWTLLALLAGGAA